MQHLPQSLSLLGSLESPMNGVRTARSLPKRLGQALLVEGVNGVARGLRIAAQRAGDLVGILAPFAGEQDLTTAQSEGIGRAQACLQGFTLGVAQRTHEYGSFHTPEDKP
jgi:hypothetical protein